MKVSFNNPNNAVWTGYGHATAKIVNALAKTDHSVGYSLPNSQLEIFFGHVEDYRFIDPMAYRVGYTAWESTQVPEKWFTSGNLDVVDEFWVPNKFTKEVFQKYTDKEIYIFRHGLDKIFQPQEREIKDTINFLHIGYPAYRKNLYDTVNAFLDLYAGRKDITLTIKAYEGVKLPEFDGEPNINVVGSTYTSFEMIRLFKEHHCLIYPSWGEGFGLIPLQTLGTGMPSIVSGGWCDYDEYIGDLKVNSELTHNPFTITHPGKMYKVDYTHLLQTIKYAEKNIESLLPYYYEQAPRIHQEYDWDGIVSEHFDNVANRLMLQ